MMEVALCCLVKNGFNRDFLQQVFNQRFSKSLAQSKRSTASLVTKLRLNSYVNSYMTLVWTSQKSRYLMLMVWDLLPRNESHT